MPDDARVSLVGLNGAGKSTLLRIIAGTDRARRRPHHRVRSVRASATCEQDAPEMGGRSVLEETLSAPGRDARARPAPARTRRRSSRTEYAARPRCRPGRTRRSAARTRTSRLLHASKAARRRCSSAWVSRMRTWVATLRNFRAVSGCGSRWRKLLLQRPDFLMLDEPTNHLDIEARNWLEDYLDEYEGGIILVSHDHYFLDRVTRRTVEVARGDADRVCGQLFLLSRERERPLRGRAGGLRKAARRNRAHGSLHQPLPLPGEQGQAGAEPDQAARKGRTAATAAGNRETARDQLSRVRAQRAPRGRTAAARSSATTN